MSLVDKILKEAASEKKCKTCKGECTCDINIETEELDEVSTPTVTEIEPLTHDYYSPEEKVQKKKKAEREKGYREEGRYEGLY